MLNRRRDFLKQAAGAAAGALTTGGIATDMSRIALFAGNNSSAAGDYRALVCVFLNGGNDGDNTIIPAGSTAYSSYASARGGLAIPAASLLPISPTRSDGRQWALHPALTELQSLFGQNRLAILANVGVLLEPTTRAAYLGETALLPPQLFSHNDQQTHWQTSLADQAARTGWGGRLADAVDYLNVASPISAEMSLAGSNVFQVGQRSLPYMISPEGVISLWYYNEAWGNTETTVTRSMLATGTANVYETSYRELFRRAIDNSQYLGKALEKAPTITTTFPAQVPLAAQLKMVAKLISIRAELGAQRQIFFCTAEGYDTHGEQLATHQTLLRQLSQSLAAFYQATVELGVSTQVTTFTASDFGRTYKSNGKGTDHGWGSHHFIMGGGVKGGDIYGTMPVQVVNGPDDTRDGRWIPTTSTDEYASTLALWYGAAAGDLPQILPNLGRFNRINLGFMN
jgi:uncharacterized protein (DUF1501 family)